MSSDPLSAERAGSGFVLVSRKVFVEAIAGLAAHSGEATELTQRWLHEALDATPVDRNASATERGEWTDPRIACDPETCGGRPRLPGHRITIAQVLAQIAESGSVPGFAVDFDLDPELISGALAALSLHPILNGRFETIARPATDPAPEDQGASSGSQATPEAPTDLRHKGFDPARGPAAFVSEACRGAAALAETQTSTLKQMVRERVAAERAQRRTEMSDRYETLDDIDPHEEAQNYEYRPEGGHYETTTREKSMLEDFATQLLEKVAVLAPAAAANEVRAALDEAWYYKEEFKLLDAEHWRIVRERDRLLDAASATEARQGRDEGSAREGAARRETPEVSPSPDTAEAAETGAHPVGAFYDWLKREYAEPNPATGEIVTWEARPLLAALVHFVAAEGPFASVGRSPQGEDPKGLSSRGRGGEAETPRSILGDPRIGIDLADGSPLPSTPTVPDAGNLEGLRQLSAEAHQGPLRGGHRCDGAIRAKLNGGSVYLGENIPAADAAFWAASANYVRTALTRSASLPPRAGGTAGREEIADLCDKLDRWNPVTDPQGCSDLMDEARSVILALTAQPEAGDGWSQHGPAEIVRRTRCEADLKLGTIDAASWRACCDTILRRLGALPVGPSPAADPGASR